MKKLLALLLVICLAIGVVGCGRPKLMNGDVDGDYEVNLNIDKDIEATLSVLVPSTDGGREGKIIDALAKGFKQYFPNVTIQKRAEPITDEFYMDTIGTLVQSETMPDLVYTNTAMYYFLVSKKVVINLEPYFEAAEETGALDMADYYENFFDMGSYEGKRYIMPRNADSVVLVYNKAMLQEAGINPKTDARMTNNWTWEDFISVSEDLVKFWDTNREKYARNYPIRQTVFDWESVWNPIMQSLGANAYENGEVAIDSDQAREFVNIYKEMVSKKISPSWDSGSMSQFLNGYTAFDFTSGGPTEFEKVDGIKGNYDFLPFPLVNGENAKIGSGFAGWGISAKSEKRDLAWAFLQYMISEEGQLAMYTEGEVSTPSLLRSLTEEKAWAKGFESFNLDAFVIHEEYKISPGYFKGFDASHVFDIQYALQDFARNCLTPSVSVEECISKAKTSLTKAIEEI